MLKSILLYVVLQLTVVVVNASQPMDLKKYLEIECNIIDPSATGFVSEDLVSANSCPEKSSLFCENGLEQAGDILQTEIKKSNIYSDYIDYTSERRQVVEILGARYFVVGGTDLIPILDIFWLEKEAEIRVELSESHVSYSLQGSDEQLSLTVERNAEDETCDFTKPQIEKIETKL